ncbi:MAG: ECF transporter S component [Candidatus Ranarchaeia archaeon]
MTSISRRSITIAYIAILAALTVVLTTIIIPMPPPIGGFDASTVLILTAGILFGPIYGTLIISLGQFIGTGFIVFSGMPIIFLPGIVAVRGVEAWLVGTLRKKNEYLALIIGPIWETIGFLIADIYLFGPVGILVITTLIDLVWVPVAIIVIAAIRNSTNVKYLDEVISQDKEGRQKLSIINWVAILLCWILIIIAPIIGLV